VRKRGGLCKTFCFHRLGDPESYRLYVLHYAHMFYAVQFRYSRHAPIEGDRLTKEKYILDGSLFGQVEVDLTSNIHASAGLRWDASTFFNSPQYNATVEEELGLRTDTAPTDLTNIQPRFQMTWDIAGRERNILQVIQRPGSKSAEPTV